MNHLNRIRIARGGCVLLPCIATTFGTSCAARVYSASEPVGVYAAAPVEDDAVLYVDAVPANIEAYPHYYYGGGYAYYVEGRWYRRGPRGWGYYRQEPPELARQRPYVLQQAPAPAFRRERHEGERTPVAPRDRPYVQQAPGVVEAQPTPAREEPRRARPADKRTAPRDKDREHER